MLYYVRYVNGVIDNVRTFNLLKLDIQQKKKKKTSPTSTLTDASMSLEAFQQSEQYTLSALPPPLETVV